MHTVIRLVVSIGLLLTCLPGRARAQCASWDCYTPRTLAAIIGQHGWLAVQQLAIGDSAVGVSGDPYPTRAALTFTGAKRPMLAAKRALVNAMLRATSRDSLAGGGYHTEYCFREADQTFWIPLQDESVAWVETHLRPGDSVTLFVIFLGDVTARRHTEWLFLATGI